MNARDKVKLLFGPYRPPALRRGDRATCLYRDCDVVITGWTAARISWPRCRALALSRGGSGLLVDDELARAIRQESLAPRTAGPEQRLGRAFGRVGRPWV